MSGFARASDLLWRAAVATAAVVAAATGAALADMQRLPDVEPPRRVVSINLCTDQLAMLLAAPGQLLAVSRLAREPQSSALAQAAQALPVTSGGGEAVFLLRPDLVLAGSFTTRATVDLLGRLGIEVAEFAPETSFDDIRANITRMGALLGREAAAQQMIAQFDADLSALATSDRPPLRAALYHANGYSPGPGTLASDILRAAGLVNIAAEAGLRTSGTLPLESLVMAAPDVVIRGARYAGASRSEAILDHPALLALPVRPGARTGPEWVCGTPEVLRAVAAMAALRRAVAAGE